MPAHSPLRSLPAVNSILESPEVASLKEKAPRGVLVAAAREALEAARSDLRRRKGSAAPPSREAIVADAVRRIHARILPSLRPVINATGIVLHTNLDRVPLAA